MKNLFSYSYTERIKFFIPVFAILLLFEWFVYLLFTPLQAYSYDILIIIGYFLFIFLLLLNGYRFLFLFSSTTILFFQGLPIKGYFVIISHTLLSILESLLYLTTLYYFITRSLYSGVLLPVSGVSPGLNNLLFSSIGKTLTLFLLLLVVLYFCILVTTFYLSIKSMGLYFSILFLYVFLLVVMFFKSKIFSSFFITLSHKNPISLFQLSSWDVGFCFAGIFVFVVMNVWLINQFFSPYHTGGKKCQ